MKRKTLLNTKRKILLLLIASSVLTARAAYLDVVVADQRVGYWRLGDAAGSTTAVNVGSLGAAGNGATVNNVAFGASGALNRDANTVANFDGAQAKIEVPFAPELNTAAFTIEAWAKVSADSTGHRSPLASRDAPRRRDSSSMRIPATTGNSGPARVNRLQAGESADFKVVVSNGAGNLTSDPATLAVADASKPVITQQPRSSTVLPGNPATFSVAEPGIRVTKACPPIPVAQGGFFFWSGTVVNSGNITLTDIVVVDDQPAPNTVVFTQASLAPGASANFTGGYMVNACCLVTDTLKASGKDVGTGEIVTATATATCEVRSVNNSPTISIIADQTIDEDGTTGPLGFTVNDVETSADSLGLSASSTNPVLVPVDNIVFGGSGNNRTVTVTPAADQDGTTLITVTVTDSGGRSANAMFLVTVRPLPPTITSQPRSQAAPLGGSVSFSVSVSGSMPLSFQWLFNGASIAGATSDTLNLPNVQTANEGSYSVTISNPAGTVTSVPANLAVITPAKIVSQPQSQTVSVGSTVTLSVSADGTPPLSFQWRVNGVNLPGATTPTLTLQNVQAANAGSYSVAIANPVGTLNSSPAAVTIDLPDLPLRNNFSDRVSVGDPAFTGRSNNLGATAENGEPLHAGKEGGRSMWLTWVAPVDGIVRFTTAGSSFDTLLAVYRGDALAGLISVASDEDSGEFFTSALSFNALAGTAYHLAIDGFAGQQGQIILSWSLEPTAEKLPEIVVQPGSRTVAPGANVTFNVVATGANLVYQWLKDGQAIAGANADSLTLANVGTANVGAYRVRVTNGNRTLESSEAFLELNSSEGGVVENARTEDKLADLARRVRSQAARQSLAPPGKIGRASASLARGFTGTQIFSTVGSTKEAGEPNHCGIIGGASQWFAYEAPASGPLVIDTDESEFDTVLAVYTGTGLDFETLTPVACDNDSGTDLKDSRVSFAAVGGTLYFVAVDGVNAATGTVVLNYRLTVPLRLAQVTKPIIEPISFRVLGEPNRNFTLQYSLDFSVWTPLLTTNTASGSFDYVEKDPESDERRFYRAVVGP